MPTMIKDNTSCHDGLSVEDVKSQSAFSLADSEDSDPSLISSALRARPHPDIRGKKQSYPIEDATYSRLLNRNLHDINGQEKGFVDNIIERWNRLSNCPSLDIWIHTELDDDIQDEDQCEIQDEDRKNTMLEKWGYIEYAETVPSAKRAKYEMKSWNHFNLRSDLADSNLYETRRYASSKFPLWNRISSQLFYYRISILFGMPPARDLDGYKCCWEVVLRHIDGESNMRLYDSKGAVGVEFNGFDTASQDGLELLNFLVSIGFQHSYDGIRAGTVA